MAEDDALEVVTVDTGRSSDGGDPDEEWNPRELGKRPTLPAAAGSSSGSKPPLPSSPPSHLVTSVAGSGGKVRTPRHVGVLFVPSNH